MNKEYILNYMDGQINVLESLKKSTEDVALLSVLQGKIDVLNDITERVKGAPVPYELI